MTCTQCQLIKVLLHTSFASAKPASVLAVVLTPAYSHWCLLLTCCPNLKKLMKLNAISQSLPLFGMWPASLVIWQRHLKGRLVFVVLSQNSFVKKVFRFSSGFWEETMGGFRSGGGEWARQVGVITDFLPLMRWFCLKGMWHITWHKKQFTNSAVFRLSKATLHKEIKQPRWVQSETWK